MISELRLINYKRFRCETIEVKPITVFIGPNGSGKSTVASAFYVLSAILRLGLTSAFPEGFFYFYNIRSYDAENFGFRFAPIGLGISGEIDDLKFDYDIIFGKNDKSPSGYFINYEGLKIKDSDFNCCYSTGNPQELKSMLPTAGNNRWIECFDSSPQRDCLFTQIGKITTDKELYTRLQNIRKYMQKVTKYQFSPSVTRMGYDKYNGSGIRPFLKSDGGNLAEVVQYLKEEERGSFQKFNENVKKYAKGCSKIADIGVGLYEEKVFLNFYEEGKNNKTFEVRGPLLADGYWVFACFACLASCQNLPSIAFFEEPESYLHPHRLYLLLDIFKNLATRDKEPCQVMISSHSPYFLDLFKKQPNSIIFLNQGKSKKLTEIKDYEKILSLYSLGEAWYSNIFNWGNPNEL